MEENNDFIKPIFTSKTILDKKGYNMYLCENLKTKCKTTFTDKDLTSAERTYRKNLDLVEVDI